MVADASIDISSDEGGVACTGPLRDAGFSSLANLPVAQLCAQAGEGGFGQGLLFESTPCQGLILVELLPEGPDCGALWVFDARTGELQGAGFECDIFAQGYGCSGGIPGFRFPDACNPLVDGGWQLTKQLCPLAGADAGSDS
jgi:hypothetical protein